MSATPDYSTNPFLPSSKPGFIPAPDPGGFLAGVRQGDPFQDGILLSPQEQAALASAPRRLPGTAVTVRAKPVVPWLPRFELGGYKVGGPDHMFDEFNDGRQWLIARGEPTKSGLGFVTGLLDGSNRVGARVDPGEQSPDYGSGYRTVASKFLPGVTADQAAEFSRRHAQGVDRGGNAYGLNTNSNSFAADGVEPMLGYRPGDGLTPGYRTRLRDVGAPPPPFDPLAPFRRVDPFGSLPPGQSGAVRALKPPAGVCRPGGRSRQ